MKDTTRAAFTAANAVDAAVAVANYATALHRAIPNDWKLVDEASGLYRTYSLFPAKTASGMDEQNRDESLTFFCKSSDRPRRPPAAAVLPPNPAQWP